MDRELQSILRYDHPWIDQPDSLSDWLSIRLPTNFIPRRQVARNRQAWASSERAHLVIGPRQAGKSTAIWSYLVGLGRPVLLIDCEQALVRTWCRSAPLFLKELEGFVGSMPILFFDEVQHLSEAGLFIKGLVDRRYPESIFVTGSASYHLGSKTRESLAGRVTRTRLLPFSLDEVSGGPGSHGPALRETLREESCRRHIQVGGYPQAWLGDSPDSILNELVNAFVIRDASDLFRIAKPDAFRRLLRLIAGQVSQLVNYSEWASILGVSRDTVAAYLNILAEGHVIHTLSPFTGGKRSELTGRPKLYFVDNGIRNHQAGELKPLAELSNPGPMLENWVASELIKALSPPDSLHFWRSTSGTEVDFVLRRPDHLVAIEVKAQDMRTPRLPRACRSFVDAYHPRRLLVVNRRLEHAERIGTTDVIWTPAQRLVEFALGQDPTGPG